MKNSKNHFRKLSLVLIAAGLSLSFTNCSPSGFEISGLGNGLVEDGNSDGSGNGGGSGTGPVTNDPATYDPAQLVSLLARDPLGKYAWQLHNTGQKIFARNANVAGWDLNVGGSLVAGYTGKGINVVVSDDGVEKDHEDLSANILLGLSYDFLKNGAQVDHAGPGGMGDMHATSVSGLIASVAGNGLGSRGIASEAKIISYNFLAQGASTSTASTLKQLSGGHHVYNMSWGYGQNTLSTPLSGWEAQLSSGTTNGRDGKGSVYVKSSGNDNRVGCFSGSGSCIGSSMFDTENNYPHIMLVGAMNGLGTVASYSSRGGNVWVANFGGEFGSDYPALVTTDRSGCSTGYSKTSATDNMFEKGSAAENSSCNYTSTFNGTSSAAPLTAGSVALLLQSNPNLSWRDVKYILAKTARIIPRVDSAHPISGTTLPSGMVFDYGNRVNKAGFTYNSGVGFGLVNVDKAIQMATASYVSPFTGTFSSVELTNNSPYDIPDNSAVGATSEINMTSNMQIEAVQIALNITHARIGQLAVDLISPSNSTYRVIFPRNALDSMANYEGERFLTNAFYMEPSQGTWKIRVYDAASGTTGSLTSWKLKIYGQTK